MSSIYKRPVDIFAIWFHPPETPREQAIHLIVGIFFIVASFILIAYVLGIQLPGPEVIVLDSMDSTEGWILREDNATGTNIQSIEGINGNAIRIDYDLGVNGAVVLIKKMPFNTISKDIGKIK